MGFNSSFKGLNLAPTGFPFPGPQPVAGRYSEYFRAHFYISSQNWKDIAVKISSFLRMTRIIDRNFKISKVQKHHQTVQI